MKPKDFGIYRRRRTLKAKFRTRNRYGPIAQNDKVTYEVKDG